MNEIFLDENFNVEKLTSQINNLMDKWSICLLDIDGPDWLVYDYDGRVKYSFHFHVDFNDLETRIKLEDLKLNIVHHIESLKDETSYRDNLANPEYIK